MTLASDHIMGLLIPHVRLDSEPDYYALTHRAFEIMAPWYDLVGPLLAPVRELVIRMARPIAGNRVLDIAAGTGQQSVAFAAAGCCVTAVDISEAMLAVARRRRRHPDIEYVHADATRLPYEDGRFDISTISFALHDMPPIIRERVVREMVRVTNPLGRIVVADYGLPAREPWRTLVLHLVRLWEADYYLDFIRSDLAKMLERHALRPVRERTPLLGLARVLLCIPRNRTGTG